MRFVIESTPCAEPIVSQVSAIDGGFWAVCGDTLIRRTAEAQIVVVSRDTAFHIQHTLLADRSGKLWVLGKTICYLEPNGTVGRAFASPEADQFFRGAQDSDGTIWAVDGRNVLRLSESAVELVQPLYRPLCVIPSRLGGVLVSAGRQAERTIWHFQKSAPAQPVTTVRHTDLSAIREACMAEDADGSLWFTAHRNLVIRAAGDRIETLPDTGQWQRAVEDDAGTDDIGESVED